MSGIDEHTLALLHFDDPNNVGEDVVNKMVWKSSGAKLSNGKWGNSLIISGRCLTSNSSDVLLKISSNNPRTIDFWFYTQKKTTQYIYLCGTITNKKMFSLVMVPDGFSFRHYAQTTSVNLSIDTNRWYHIAHVYDGATEYLFIDGKKVYSENVLLTTGSDLFYFTTDYSSPFSSTSTFVDEFRISDIARWTEDFTPPILPFSRANQLYIDQNNAVWGCKP